MPTLAAPAQEAFDRLAADLARGEEIAADRVLVTLAAAGRTTSDLQDACDRFAAEQDPEV